MAERGGVVSGNRQFIISQVEGEHSSGVGRRPCAEQMPHVRLLLEAEGRNWQRGNWRRVWQPTKSEETLVKVEAMYILD